MKLILPKGSTSVLVDIPILDSSSTTGAALAGLAYNTGSLTAYYYRNGASSAVAITLADMTVGTWVSGGFKIIDATNMPGMYQLGIPDAALTTGARSTVIYLKGASNMAQTRLEIQLTDFSLYSASVTVGAISNNVITSASIQDNAFTAAKFAEDGTCQAGSTSTTVKLAAGASSTNDYYNDQLVYLVEGTGGGQTRRITDYDGATRVATVDEAWITTPDNTTTYNTVPNRSGSSIASGAITDTSLTAAGCNKIADHIWRRANSNIEASSSGDTLGFRSPYGAVASLTNKFGRNGLSLETYKQDDATLLGSRAITFDASLLPISSLDPS